MNQQDTSVGQHVEEREPSCTIGGKADWCGHCGKQRGGFLKKFKMDLPYVPLITLLGICLKKPETLIQKNISTPVFIAALFTIAKIWKQSPCPSVDEWVRK